MASATTFVQDWLRYWGNLTTRFTGRLESASREARRREYTTDKLVSDTVGLWADGVDAWYTALMGRGAAEPAVLLFRISQTTDFKVGTECKTDSVRVSVPSGAVPERTELVRVGGGRAIPTASINAKLTPAGDELVVSLVDLGNPAVRPDVGYYLGLVHVGERPLVLLHAVVTP